MQRLEGIGLLRELCCIPGPTGSEERVAALIRQQLSDLTGVDIYSDRVGNLTVRYAGGGEDYNDTSPARVMVSAHMDEVGMMINEITDEGYLRFANLGGIDPRVLCGRHVTVMGKSGDIPGVIASKAIHHQTPDERRQATPVDKMYISIGASSREEAEKYVSVGDSATFDSDFICFGNGKIKGKAIDDRLGCSVMIETLRHLVSENKKLPYDVYFCFTVREEIGLSGAQTTAQRLEPDTALVLESTAVADIAGVAANSRVAVQGEGGAISLADRSTLYDRRLLELAMSTAAASGIKAQIKRLVSGGNDAGHIHKSGKGVRALAISCPTRYIHSASCVADMADYEAILKLVCALIDGGRLA